MPVIILLVGVEMSLRYIPNDYQLKYKFLESNSDELEVLILGNSHAFHGVNPDLMEKSSFNVSNVSQSFDIDYAIFNQYKSNLPNLNTLVITFTYTTLVSKLENSVESWRLKNYFLYFHLNECFSLKNSTEITANKMSLNVERIKDYYFEGENYITCTELGYSPKEIEEGKDLKSTGVEASKRHTKDINTAEVKEITEEVKSQLIETINWCGQNNINVVILTPPAFKSYTKNLNLNQLQIKDEFCDSVSLYCEHVVYLDLLEDTTFKQEDFYDADHLNVNGATKLTLILNDLIMKF